MFLREVGKFLPRKAGVLNSRKRTFELGIDYFPWEGRVKRLGWGSATGLLVKQIGLWEEKFSVGWMWLDKLYTQIWKSLFALFRSPIFISNIPKVLAHTRTTAIPSKCILDYRLSKILMCLQCFIHFYTRTTQPRIVFTLIQTYQYLSCFRCNEFDIHTKESSLLQRVTERRRLSLSYETRWTFIWKVGTAYPDEMRNESHLSVLHVPRQGG